MGNFESSLNCTSCGPNAASAVKDENMRGSNAATQNRKPRDTYALEETGSFDGFAAFQQNSERVVNFGEESRQNRLAHRGPAFKRESQGVNSDWSPGRGIEGDGWADSYGGAYASSGYESSGIESGNDSETRVEARNFIKEYRRTQAAEAGVGRRRVTANPQVPPSRISPPASPPISRKREKKGEYRIPVSLKKGQIDNSIDLPENDDNYLLHGH